MFPSTANIGSWPGGPGGCPPRAPTDPYLHTLEHTAPQVMDSLLDVGVDDLGPRKRITPQQPFEPIPDHHATAIAAIKPLSPCAGNCPKEPVQRLCVARDSIVRVMSADFLAQFRVLFRNRKVSVRPTPLRDAPHCAAQPLRGRLPRHRPSAPPSSAPIMGETQQGDSGDMNRYWRSGKHAVSLSPLRLTA